MEEILKPSPNFTEGRNGEHPEIIVVHIMQGTLAGTDAWFANKDSKVSAHIGIGRLGEVHRYIADFDTAWHSGIKTTQGATFKGFKYGENGNLINVNSYSLGIEHEGFPDNSITEEQYLASAHKIAEWCEKYDIPADAEHIVSHSSICPLHGKCPNGSIDLTKLIDKVNDILN